MVTIAEARKAVLSLPGVEEKSHFDKPDFRVKNKIFAVIHSDKKMVVVKLSAIDQDVFVPLIMRSYFRRRADGGGRVIHLLTSSG